MIYIKTKFLIVGRTSSGKDSMTNYLCNELGLKQLLSYSTRPKRFPEENTHEFISIPHSNYIQATEDIIAYAQIGEIEYYATYQQFMDSDIYVIDYNGIKYFRDNYQQKLIENGIQTVTIYIHTNDDLRAERAMKRCNDIVTYNQRCIDENEQFTEIESNVDYDWFVNNNDGEKAKKIIKEIVKLYL